MFAIVHVRDILFVVKYCLLIFVEVMRRMHKVD